jgi:hypothetical protein
MVICSTRNRLLREHPNYQNVDVLNTSSFRINIYNVERKADIAIKKNVCQQCDLQS